MSLRNQCYEKMIVNTKYRYFKICIIHASLYHSTAARYSTFMEVIKAVARQGSATVESVAIRANQKSYSYNQLISSARKISSLLCNGDIKPVSSKQLLINFFG